MLNKCANPGCNERFRKLDEGKLFLVEAERMGAEHSPRQARHLEHYWLCNQCALMLTLSFDTARGVVTVPLAPATRKIPAASVRPGEGLGTALAENSYPTRMMRGGVHEA
ncbi:MAG: hypothetical protein WAL32_06525 [Terriglobales bacterium]